MAEHEEHTRTHPPDHPAAGQEAEQEAVQPDQSAPEETGVSEQGADPLASLQQERDQLEARLLRVSADYQNYVRRSQQNAQDACQQQLFQMAKALLTPLDHFDHALAADPEKTSAQAFVKGVEIVRDELTKVLEQFGVRRLEVNTGDAFDPLWHQAVQRLSVEGVESGAVAGQIQPGYVLGDKALRPAKVIVAE